MDIRLFENIALCFSGGGFRAAAFCLGVLSFLDEFKLNGNSLLKHVKGLSTVSGGTITGAAYVDFLLKGDVDDGAKRFQDFYCKMYDFLAGDSLLNSALQKMEDDALWQKTYKKRTLINCFSLAYRDFYEANFGQLTSNKVNVHLEDVCFNATEFSYGLAFRFQKDGCFGNYRINLPQNAAAEIQIADAVASSSCFPLGFAPLIMPDDYLDHTLPVYKGLKKQKDFEYGIGIMDGGIVDNQGIGSTILANQRRIDAQKQGYDLILVCDVASYMMEPWKQSNDVVDQGITLRQLASNIWRRLVNNWGALLILLVGLVLSYFGIQNSFPNWTKLILWFSGTFVITGGTLLVLRYILRIIKPISVWLLKNNLNKYIPKFFLKKARFFDDLRMTLLKRMTEERLSSGFKMVNEVFLKQIRRLNYQMLYKDENLKHRRATVLIYQLTKAQFKKGESTEVKPSEKISVVREPSPAIFEVAKTATEMNTTLWFTPTDVKKDVLKKLIACGRFTVCYSLLEYLNDLSKHTDHNLNHREINTIRHELTKHWDRFVDDPYAGLPTC